MSAKLLKLLSDLKELANARIVLDKRAGFDEIEAAEIALIEAMDKVSRLIDPEHRHYAGE